MNQSKIISFQILLFLIIFCACSSDILAQENEKIKIFPDVCEVIGGKLDVVGIEFNKLEKDDSYLIILGNSSKGEKSRYNNDRIADAIKYITKFHEIKNERVVYGVSPLANELGRLEFYVSGKLVVEIRFAKKSKLCFGIGETFD